MEAYVLEVFLCHLKNIARVGKEDVAAVAVFRHVLILALLEVLELTFVVAFYPAGLIEMYGLPTAFGVVLVLEAVLYDFKLQLSYGADDFSSVKLIDKQLCHTFVHELIYASLKLLGFHRIVVLDVFE